MELIQNSRVSHVAVSDHMTRKKKMGFFRSLSTTFIVPHVLLSGSLFLLCSFRSEDNFHIEGFRVGGKDFIVLYNEM